MSLEFPLPLLRLFLLDIQEAFPEIEGSWREWQNHSLFTSKRGKLLSTLSRLHAIARLLRLREIEQLLSWGRRLFSEEREERNERACDLFWSSLVPLSSLGEEQYELWREEVAQPISTLSLLFPERGKEEEKEKGDIQEEKREEEREFSSSVTQIFFRELSQQVSEMSETMLSLVESPEKCSEDVWNRLIGAAHSMKGSSATLHLSSLVSFFHSLESFFLQYQEKGKTLLPERLDFLLKIFDRLSLYSQLSFPSLLERLKADGGEWESFIKQLSEEEREGEHFSASSHILIGPKEEKATCTMRALSVDPSLLGRVIGLSGELFVHIDQLDQFTTLFFQIKREEEEILHRWEENGLLQKKKGEEGGNFYSLYGKQRHLFSLLIEAYASLQLFVQEHRRIARQLYDLSVQLHMRPFSEGVRHFRRMVHDLSRKLGKQVHFLIQGEGSCVDRQVLERLEAPLTHLLRNAIDHGIESSQERVAQGKKEKATIILSAAHRAGKLQICVEDDGCGIDYQMIRERLSVESDLTKEQLNSLREDELSDYLFLPSFSTRSQTTEISGRGVGMNVVQSTVRELQGAIHLHSQKNLGVRWELELPLTHSVKRSLLFMLNGELYALPLLSIDKVMKIPFEELKKLEGQFFISLDQREIPLLSLAKLLELQSPPCREGEELSILFLSDCHGEYGFIVDRWTTEKNLVLSSLPPLLTPHLPHIAAASILERGVLLLLLDANQILESARLFFRQNRLAISSREELSSKGIENRKSILIVEDSPTVAQLERELLESHGIKVSLAVDGEEGWLLAQNNHYDLILSDIDLPKMNGYALTGKIRADPSLCTIPVVLFSYRDGEKDRLHAKEVGANQLLSKNLLYDSSLFSALQPFL